MKKNVFLYWTSYLSVLLLFAACAGLQPEVTVGPEGGEKVLAVEASSFKFVPNNVRANTGDVILLKIENVSESTHNFTIQNPDGQMMQSVDLPPGKTTDVRVTLPQRGEYDFYCDKPFHSTFGMKGRIEAVDRQDGPAR